MYAPFASSHQVKHPFNGFHTCDFLSDYSNRRNGCQSAERVFCCSCCNCISVFNNQITNFGVDVFVLIRSNIHSMASIPVIFLAITRIEEMDVKVRKESFVALAATVYPYLTTKSRILESMFSSPPLLLLLLLQLYIRI